MLLTQYYLVCIHYTYTLHEMVSILWRMHGHDFCPYRAKWGEGQQVTSKGGNFDRYCEKKKQ